MESLLFLYAIEKQELSVNDRRLGLQLSVDVGNIIDLIVNNGEKRLFNVFRCRTRSTRSTIRRFDRLKIFNDLIK